MYKRRRSHFGFAEVVVKKHDSERGEPASKIAAMRVMKPIARQRPAAISNRPTKTAKPAGKPAAAIAVSVGAELISLFAPETMNSMAMQMRPITAARVDMAKLPKWRARVSARQPNNQRELRKVA